MFLVPSANQVRMQSIAKAMAGVDDPVSDQQIALDAEAELLQCLFNRTQICGPTRWDTVTTFVMTSLCLA